MTEDEKTDIYRALDEYERSHGPRETLAPLRRALERWAHERAEAILGESRHSDF